MLAKQQALRPHPREPASGSAAGTAVFQAKSRNRKLAPVILAPAAPRPRPIATGPFVSSTYASIAATCTEACGFKEAGCYVRAGATRKLTTQLDAAALGHSADEVIAAEADLIGQASARGVPQDGARGGRDLRLHVGGDVLTAAQARMLAAAARRWRRQGGGAVWTFTHSWREVARSAWGNDIAVLASVERPADIEIARTAGYAAALVVDEFPSSKAFRLPGASARLIPCPAETKGRTCIECRLCDRDLLGMNAVVRSKLTGRRRAPSAMPSSGCA